MSLKKYILSWRICNETLTFNKFFKLLIGFKSKFCVANSTNLIFKSRKNFSWNAFLYLESFSYETNSSLTCQPVKSS